jgi:hypothetical protein
MSPFGHDQRRDTAEATDRDTMLSTERPVAERRMKVALVLVVGMTVLIALVALAELLRVAANRLLGGILRRGRRWGRASSSSGVWVDARVAWRDAEVLQSGPDIGTEWTAWERRGRRGR